MENEKLTESIVGGLENNEFKMYLQFIVCNKTKQIVSAEALSRWEKADGEIISPASYIKIMESTGLITRHDYNMFELACCQLEKWRDSEYKDITISCNFTRISLSEDGIVENLRLISDKYNFDRSKLAIEITEDAMEKNTEKAVENAKHIKELGFKIYLDDLGCGYTSLSNLRDYPIDVVKIDRDIMLKADSPKGKDLFLGIVELSHKLDIDVICEGVETSEQNALVSESGCDYIQGWYYSNVLPVEKCEKFINEYKIPKCVV